MHTASAECKIGRIVGTTGDKCIEFEDETGADLIEAFAPAWPHIVMKERSEECSRWIVLLSRALLVTFEVFDKIFTPYFLPLQSPLDTIGQYRCECKIALAKPSR